MPKMMNRKLVALAVLALGAPAAFAQTAGTGVDFTSLTTGISFGGVVAGILAIAAVKVLPLVASWGGRKILGMIGR